MHAHVTNGIVDSVGRPPDLAYDGTRWWDLRTLNLATLAIVGWFPVTEVTRPADTASTTWDVVYTLNGSVVVQSWVERPKTAEEIAAALASSNSNTIRQLLTDTLPTLETITNTTNAAMTGNTAAAAIKDEARAIRRIIRLLTDNLSATN